jgi:hypothetical protein
MNNQILKKVTNMRLGICSDDQYIVSDENIKNVLSNQKYQNTWLTGLLKCIEYVKSKTNVERMIEIGCYQGESTTLFAHGFKPSELYAIDPFENGYDDTDSSSIGDFTDIIYNFNSRISHFPCIKHIKDYSYNVSNQFKDNSFDFIYIDGNHTFDAVVNDIKLYLPKIKTNSFIGGHDWGNGNVVNAVLHELKDVDIFFEDSSWIIQVTEDIKQNKKL